MDLSLSFGDIELVQADINSSDNILYDLKLYSIEESLSLIVRRTLETPFRYIRLYIEQGDTIEELDGLYGDRVYEKLSEPFTTSILVEIKNDIQTALDNLKDIPAITILGVNLISYNLDSLNISVDYKINSTITSTIINLPL